MSHPIYPLSLKFCIEMNEENKNMVADFFSFNGKDFAIEKEVSANVSKKSAFAKLGEKISSAIPKGKLNEYYDSVAGVVGTGAKKVSSVLDKQKSKIYDCYDDLLDAAGSDSKNVTAKDLDDIVQFSAKGAAASSAAA